MYTYTLISTESSHLQLTSSYRRRVFGHVLLICLSLLARPTSPVDLGTRLAKHQQRHTGPPIDIDHANSSSSLPHQIAFGFPFIGSSPKARSFTGQGTPYSPSIHLHHPIFPDRPLASCWTIFWTPLLSGLVNLRRNAEFQKQRHGDRGQS